MHDMMTADQMEALDRANGVMEVCINCNVEHFAKSPLCDACNQAERMMEVDAMEPHMIGDNEPIFWEIA